MSWLSFLELEERVGTLWHRWVGEKASWPSFPEAQVSLDSVRPRLAVFFRGLGGDRGVQIANAAARESGHRLSLRQRIGMETERLVSASRDQSSLSLPPTLALFPAAELNRDLYFWLAAYFAVLEPLDLPSDPLAADLARLAQASRTTRAVLRRFPGLAARHGALCAALLEARPRRSLSGAEAKVEAAVLSLLADPGAALPPLPAKAPREYLPLLPVPLWGECLPGMAGALSPADAEPERGGEGEESDEQETRRKAERRDEDNADRKDPLLLNRFEKILAMADMVNVNRAADDTDEEEAKKAADDMEAITLSSHSRKAATKLKFDLDLPPGATDASRLTGTFLLPEWDWRANAYLPDHCSVLVGPASEEGEDWSPDADAKRRIRAVKRQFEALRTKPQLLRAQADGQELDTDALVRARADLAACGTGSDRVWLQHRAQERDLSVMVLMDASLSTDSWIDNRRVLDVEKESLAVLGHGLAACGDPFAVATFTSRKRDWVKVDMVKDFHEPFGDRVLRRIGAVRPGYYTRIGAALRYATTRLEERPERHRLLLVLTDGKPNDVDHYEGRHGVEDTRKAVLEARAKGLSVFGITVDRKAQGYFPHLFGRGHYAIIGHLAHLSAALPKIYRQLVA
ncbi:nitric oxide reductase activation protein NorD [Paramagnetospirillum magneticum]|uniref:Nitric oxide reductase activation protein n=1 Tax=Paramagnetospirillum magneticum (strain ATCC 700264 / AMB-1) TaxID=342108 RepID=Q2W329_PARM1|nr:VWA domain-containing protein [Paramagnetospirillum magneticum]BAE51746.1 Nitric oxide reductase activation protein [Paramagnetospirillum magneticum AMB-1]